MSRDNFAGGFLLGAIVGGVVGGVIGATIASSRFAELQNADELEGDEGGRKPLTSDESRIEVARRGLEGKIAKLNSAIDAVRQQLGNVNGSHTNQEISSAYSEDS